MDPEPRPADLSIDDPLAPLHRWIADGRVDEAARARARQHWLERQAAEGATLAGVMTDLAERGDGVTITTVGARRLTGPIVALGADFVVVRDDRLGDGFVPLARVGAVRSAPGQRLPVGDRSVASTATLVSALAQLAIPRPDVSVEAGGDRLNGALLSVGADVATLTLDGPRRDRVHVHLAAIDHLLILRH